MGIEITDDQQEEFKEINAADAKVDLRDHFTHVQTALFDSCLSGCVPRHPVDSLLAIAVRTAAPTYAYAGVAQITRSMIDRLGANRIGMV